tara:strand:+ start:4656 stop:5279 length:624 start_codon:yes stop_codon:yes gene_type:complete
MKFNKYQVIKKAINKELTNFIFEYLLLKKEAVKYIYENNIIQSSYIHENQILGTWNDGQVPNTYSIYGDHVMEVLLTKVLLKMEQETKMKLVPTYSYTRLYENGAELKRHKDRPSCEISTTIHLGGEPWPIFIEPSGKLDKSGKKVLLDVGDMLVYSGNELEHWREPFEGTTCGQVFLHYNHVNGPFAEKNRFDKRPMLGVPPIRNT